jgi:DNA-binding MarR family transcriptional regulator
VALPRIDDEPLNEYRVEEQVGFLLRRAHQRHVAIFQEGMAEADLTPTQFTALIKIVEQGPLGQNRLGRLAAMDPATIQGVVRRLIARNLVASMPDPADRRAVLLAPTAAGRHLVDVALAPARSITAATLAPLDRAEQRQFLALLRKMV